MIIRTLNDIIGTDREVKDPRGKWVSRRLLLASDGMGYSLHNTVVQAGAELEMEYKHHLEASYCIAGRGEIENLATGEKYPIEAGMVYALDKHDRHIVRAFETMTQVCIFNPALTGDEVHDEDGAFRAPDENSDGAT